MNKNAAKVFADDCGGNENSDYQDFWRDLLHDVFGVERTKGFIKFIEPVGDTLWKMDAYIPKTRVLIEHKSFGKDLTKKFQQSDGKLLTPYEQALRYAKVLNEPPRWIVTCNFAEFRIYKPDRDEPTVIKLRDLRYQFDNEYVHCVVVGFSSEHNDKPKIIFDGDKKIFATNINAYLVDGEDIFVESRPNPPQDGVPAIGIGNKPIDNGNYLFTPEEMDDFIGVGL